MASFSPAEESNSNPPSVSSRSSPSKPVSHPESSHPESSHVEITNPESSQVEGVFRSSLSESSVSESSVRESLQSEWSTKPVSNQGRSDSSTKKKSLFSAQEWMILVVLFFVQFSNILDFVLMMPLAPLTREELNLSTEQFGLALSAYGFTAILGSLFGALWLDRFDRKRSMLVMFTGFIAGTFLCGFASRFEILVAGRAVAGLFGGVLGSSVLAIVGDLFQAERRGRAMGVVMSGFAVASVVGVPLGLGIAESTGTIGSPFLALAGFAVLICIAALLTLPQIRVHMQQGTPKTSVVTILKRPAVLWAFLFMSLIVFSGFSVIPFIADYMVKNGGQKPEHIKWVYLIAGMVTFVSTNFMGWATDKLGRLRVFRMVATTAAIVAVVFTNLPEIPFGVALVAATFYMVFTSARMVPSQALISEAVPPQERGRFFSLMNAVTHGVMAIAALIAGLVVGTDEQGHLTRYWLTGVLALFAGLFSVVVAGYLFHSIHSRAILETGTPRGS